MKLTLIISGPIKPYTRVGRERWTKRAKAYFASRDAIRLSAKSQAAHWNWKPTTKPVKVKKAVFFRKRRLGDLDNLLKAVLDACEGVVFLNDRQIVAIDEVKVIRPAAKNVSEDWDACHIEFEITEELHD